MTMITTPEDKFDIAQATITDVGFLGFFPKTIFQELRTYARELEQLNVDSGEFQALMNQLIIAFIYRPITIQKVIHILIAAYKQHLEQSDQRRTMEESPDNATCTTETMLAPSCSIKTASAKSAGLLSTPPRKCYAVKCRLLLARGIIRELMSCTPSRNICSGCCNEAARQKQTLSIEKEIVHLSVDNPILVPLLEFRMKPLSIKALRKTMRCLPAFAKPGRNDHKFGVAKYLANTLGIQLEATQSSQTMDMPLTTRQRNELQRQALHLCRCSTSGRKEIQYTVRDFCQSSSYIFPQQNAIRCIGCSLQDCYETTGILCLSCQFTTIAFRNPFSKRLDTLLDTWLPDIRDTDDSSDLSAVNFVQKRSPISKQIRHQDLLKMHALSIDNTLNEICSRSLPEQNHYVFEDLKLLQRDIRNHNNGGKRDIESVHSASATTLEIVDENLSPRKKGSLSKELFPEIVSDDTETSLCRPPLFPLDMNPMSRDTSSQTQQIECATDGITSRKKRNFKNVPVR